MELCWRLRGVKISMMRSLSLVITKLWSFWSPDVTSTMNFPPLCSFNLKINIPWKTCHFRLSLLNFPQGVLGWKPLNFFLSAPSPKKSKKHCSHCRFLSDLCDLSTWTGYSLREYFCSGAVAQVFSRRKVWTKVIQPTTSSNQRHTKLGDRKKGKGWKVHTTPPLNQKWAWNEISWWPVGVGISNA